MTKYTFKQKDFKVFSVEGLENRMQALDEQIRPQLHALGERYTKYLTEQTGDTFHYHVAKHARRTVNPLKIHGLPLRLINVDIKCYHIFKLAYLNHNYL